MNDEPWRGPPGSRNARTWRRQLLWLVVLMAALYGGFTVPDAALLFAVVAGGAVKLLIGATMAEWTPAMNEFADFIDEARWRQRQRRRDA